MKILLLNSNLGHKSRSGGVGHPIGLLYVAGALLRNDYKNIEILDANALGYDLKTTISTIISKHADVVGITITTPTSNIGLWIAKILKIKCPNIKIVVGGIHATIFAEELLKLPYIDTVVSGECEEIIKEAIEEEGLVRAKRFVPPESIPNPAWYLLDLSLYRNALTSNKFAMLMTSRGCPFQCTFCSAHLMCGKKVRYRILDKIREELDYLKQIGVKTFIFQDDSFTINQNFVYNLSLMILHKKLSWWCNTRVDLLDKDLLKTMKEGGCKGICLGIESGNQEILEKMKKGITIDEVKNKVELIKETGIKTYGYFMIGNLDDTNETIRETIDFAKNLPLDYAQFSVCTPFPASELWEIAKNRGVIPEDIDWSKFDWEGNPPNVSQVSDEERKMWYNKAIREFYFRPKYLFKHLNLSNIKTGLRLLKK